MTDDVVKRLPLSIYHQQFQRYVDAGYQPRPVDPGTKRCSVKGWQADVATVTVSPRREYGLGLRLGTRLPAVTHLVVLDIDSNEHARLARALAPSPCGRFGSKGIALFARTTDEVGKFDLKLADRNKAGELLGAGSLCVIPDTIHPDTGQKYQWTDKPLLEIESQQLPLIDPKLVKAVFASEHLPVLMAGTATHDALLRFVGQLVNLSDDDDHIERVATACFPENYAGDSLRELPRMIQDARRKFDSGRWRNAQSAGGAPAFSDDHLAQEFVARHGDDFRHVAKGVGWMLWNETRWREDDKMVVFRRSREICREFSHEAGKKLARAIASAKTRAAVVSMAQDDPRIAAVVDQWDADPWLLNTPGGTVDLQTGRLNPHDRNDYITKVAAVAPDLQVPGPTWSAFLDRVTAGDRELQAYLQRASGYMLTGLTSEHALFFLYGTGANGKSTFIETVTGIVADYARPVPMKALMWSRNEQHPTEIAGLRGARIASAVETGKGGNWDEPKIMVLTGGDKISARFMRQDFFDFRPQFKLLVAGNHKPGLRSVNEATRRRLHLVPFTVTIPPPERDPYLGDALKREWPGILTWMIEGCLQWQRQGLAPPEAVTKATGEYLEAQDMVAQFLDEHCVADPRGQVKSSVLFEKWKMFVEQTGDRLRPQKEFNADIENKGFRRDKTEGGMVFFGLRLKQVDGEEAEHPGSAKWERY